MRAGYAYAEAGEVGLDLLDHAQSAYRAARDQARSTPAEYIEERGRETTRTQRIEAELHTAIAEGDLRAHFQPVVDLRDGFIVGLEALVRWPRGRGALLLPDDFLPVAEAAGLMPDVGQWMLDRVLDAVEQLRALRLGRHLRVWINLGAHEVAGADEVLRRIEAAIADGTLNPREIGFEVTESTVLDDLDSAVESLAALRRLGVEIALDDFGTGYSSLSYLRRLPVTAVKIDRSFVAGLGHSQADEAIVEAVIDLAHALGLRVIAEGVEDSVQVDRARRARRRRGAGLPVRHTRADRGAARADRPPLGWGHRADHQPRPRPACRRAARLRLAAVAPAARCARHGARRDRRHHGRRHGRVGPRDRLRQRPLRVRHRPRVPRISSASRSTCCCPTSRNAGLADWFAERLRRRGGRQPRDGGVPRPTAAPTCAR